MTIRGAHCWQWRSRWRPWQAPPFAGPFEDADAALARRDYASALRLLSQARRAKATPPRRPSSASLYEFGWGTPQDYAAALKWYRVAADKGFGGAQNNLGVMFENGLGVTQNYAEAVKWYRRAADLDYAEAQNNLGNMYRERPGRRRRTMRRR